MGRCINVMHGFICKNDISGLGVTFPAWTDSSIGHVIAFVHTDAAILDDLKQQPYFKDMAELDVFSITSVAAVPKGCAEVRFKRNQGIAKMFVGETRRRLKRLEKRALARGDVFKPVKHLKQREFETFHCIAMGSATTSQDFLLHVQKESLTTQEKPDFSQYGLASNKVHIGSVPELSTILTLF
uniref:CRISPR-associated protein, Cse2 family n=1 Tax=Rheinheimera sp. BAL341 TaxID=1708203 RepID=A0A486XJJ7_9GAMM